MEHLMKCQEWKRIAAALERRRQQDILENGSGSFASVTIQVLEPLYHSALAPAYELAEGSVWQ